VAFIQYMKRFFQPVRDLAEKYNILQAAMAASERVFGLLDTPAEVTDPPQGRLPARVQGEIRIHDLWFSYHPGEWVLRSVHLHVHPGETVAIVGATGAGKSSLIGLLGRAYDPQRGEILLDGVEIREWKKENIRRHVGIVPQDVFLFSGSLLENLRLWDPRVPEERVREVAQTLGLARWVERLPGGYGMLIGERGENLSLGQRQLLAFARALIYDPGVLILDEATSSVDPSSEAMIQEAMGPLTHGRTSLIIAHRLSTIQAADRIVVLHRGTVHEEGTHRELLARDGIYQRLYRLHQSMREPPAVGS
jgi:ABC-type multidrug transport system fused ATPase/permease subunit